LRFAALNAPVATVTLAMIDVAFKGASLLWTQATCALAVLFALPLCAARAALDSFGWRGGDDAANAADSNGVLFYEGRVTHARKRPVANAFEYDVRAAVISLDAPPAWFARSGQANDHMTAAAARAFAGTDGPVLLLTNPKSLGYVQNPISVYYCYDAAGSEEEDEQQQQQQHAPAAAAASDSPASRTRGAVRRRQRQPEQQQQQHEQNGGQAEAEPLPPWVPKRPPRVAIAEVTNTPWGDRVRFCFDPRGAASPKALHVSPFMDMGNEWHLKATPPGDALRLSVVVTHPELGQYFDAHLMASRCTGAYARARNEAAGWRALARYAFMPQRVAVWIYWQAVVLIVKGCPVYARPEGASFKPRVAREASGKLPAAGGAKGGCPYEWQDTRAWPWYL
jgi:DUF1365 family protein